MRLTRNGSSRHDLSAEWVTFSYNADIIAEWLELSRQPISVRFRLGDRDPINLHNITLIEMRDGQYGFELDAINAALMAAYAGLEDQLWQNNGPE